MPGTSHGSAEKRSLETVLRVRLEVTPEPTLPSLIKPQERETSWQMRSQLCSTKGSSRNQTQAEENGTVYCCRGWHLSTEAVDVTGSRVTRVTQAQGPQPGSGAGNRALAW